MTRFAVLVGAILVLAGTPVSASAATAAPVRKPVPVRRSVPWSPYRPPAPLRTVDHPPVDGVRSFDNGPRDANRLALTFDADMTPFMLGQLQRGAVASWYNREVVDILRQEGVPATIFMTGLWAQAYPDVARDLAADPSFEIGSHTFDHSAFRTPCYGLFGASDRTAEIETAQIAIASVTGVTPRLIRFPGDCYDVSDVSLAASEGLSVISGDVRGGDGFNPSSASVVGVVMNQARGGSIILLHLQGGPNAPMTAPALRQVIPALRAAGYQFVTVSDLLGLERAIPSPPPMTTAQTAVASRPDPAAEEAEPNRGTHFF